MKKLIIAFCLFIDAFALSAQVVKPDAPAISPAGPNTKVYYDLKIRGSFFIPHYSLTTPPIGQDTIGKFVLNTDDNHVHVKGTDMADHKLAYITDATSGGGSHDTIYFKKFTKLVGTDTLELFTDTSATSSGNYVLALNSNGYLIKLNAVYSAATNTITYTGIKINAKGGLQIPGSLTGQVLTATDTLGNMHWGAGSTNIYNADGIFSSIRTATIPDTGTFYLGNMEKTTGMLISLPNNPGAELFSGNPTGTSYSEVGVDETEAGMVFQTDTRYAEVRVDTTNVSMGLQTDTRYSFVNVDTTGAEMAFRKSVLGILKSSNLTISDSKTVFTDEINNQGILYGGTYFSSDSHWLTPKRYVDSLVAAGGGTTTNAVTFNNSGSGATSPTTFNGSVAKTISYNTIGAQQALTLTTTGTNGAATLSAGTLNIPAYTLAGLGGQPALSGTGFVKISGTTISYDNSTYLTSITSGMVTTALGFTPYNATNPSGYITSSVTTLPSLSLPYSQVTGTPSLSGYQTTANLQTTLSASASQYPSSTAVQNYVTGLGYITSSGTATNISATSNSSLTTLSALSLPYSQVTGTPSLAGYEVTSNKTATASTSTTTYPNWLGVENYVTSVLPAAITASNGVIRTVNNLTSDTTYNRSVNNSLTLAQLQTKFNGYVPTTRTVAGFTLSSNVTLATETYSTGLVAGSYNGSTAATLQADTTFLKSKTSSLTDYNNLSTRINGKQAALSGVGFIKISGTTISYDNSTYLTGITSSQVTTALGFTPIGATNFITGETPSGSINGSNTSFTAANAPVTGTIKMFWNGVRTTKFTATGSAITTIFVANTGDTILIDYQK